MELVKNDIGDIIIDTAFYIHNADIVCYEKIIKKGSSYWFFIASLWKTVR